MRLNKYAVSKSPQNAKSGALFHWNRAPLEYQSFRRIRFGGDLRLSLSFDHPLLAAAAEETQNT
jgi:hypothetical protein